MPQESFAGTAPAFDRRSDFVERLLDASDDCIKILDLDARLLSMSPNGQKALAIMNFASVEGADWHEFWQGDDRAAARAAVSAARSGERGRFSGFFPVEGRERWWDVTVTPILGPDGRPERLLAVSRDITENVLVNRALARSEERYRLLGEALPGTAWSATPDGLLDNIIGTGEPNAKRLPVATRLGDRWLDTVRPDERERVRARWRLALETGERYDTQFPARMADGSYRWQLVRALPHRDESGTIVRWVGVNVDIDDQRRADEAREQFVRLVEASDDFIGIADRNGEMTYVNAAGRRLLGIGDAEAPRAMRFIEFFVPEDRPFVESDILPATERGGHWIGDFRMRHFGTGERVPVWYNAFSLRDESGIAVGTASVSRDLRDRRRIEVGMRALAETGAAMYGSLDFAGTVENVADTVVRSFASCCLVDVLHDGAPSERIAAIRTVPPATFLEYERTIFERGSEHPTVRAIERGESTLLAALPPDWARALGLRTVAVAEGTHAGVRSLIVVPIRSATKGGACGALTCVIDGLDQRGTYTAEDVRFAEEIAVRAGLAFDRARAYERERRIAVTLQEASLSHVLPAARGLTLSAEYRPGKSEATIGGDWYDAFFLDDGRLAITVGDVLGNGLGAAVTMGKVRQAMRSAAMLIPTPSAMLDVADRTVRAEPGDVLATAVAGIYDPRSQEFTFASAGHPGPVLRDPSGRIADFDAPGLLLGLRSGREEAQTLTLAAAPGSLRVFFTDGLVEATRDIEEGYRRLHAAIRTIDSAGGAQAARTLVEHVLRGEPATDDIAVLVAAVDREASPPPLRAP